MGLPTGYDERKAFPLMTFLSAYFPDTIEALVALCVQGNKQHDITVPKDNPFYIDGDRIAWDRSKSTEELETLMRHLWDHTRAKRADDIDKLFDSDGVLHIVKTTWRAAAEAQKTIEMLAKFRAERRKAWDAAQGDTAAAAAVGCSGCGSPPGQPHNWPGCSGVSV